MFESHIKKSLTISVCARFS